MLEDCGGKWRDGTKSCLTLTSAFLLRRLLAAAERQNDTPSDGSVHILMLLHNDNCFKQKTIAATRG